MPLLEKGDDLFNECYNLTAVKGDFSGMYSASYMFIRCYDLTSFDCKIPNLTYAPGMFNECFRLSSFKDTVFEG